MELEMVYSLILLMITCITLLIHSRKPNHNKNKLPPSPAAVPIIGRLRLLGSRLHRSLESLSARYGPILYTFP